LEIRWRAVSFLAAAGSPHHDGTPYPGAGERLMRIVEYAPGVGIRAGALHSLLAQPDRAQTLRYLRDVAVSGNQVAYVAVGFLGRDTGPEGLAILRELHRTDAVVEPIAKRELEGIARWLLRKELQSTA
jgi:hypothetical protein